MNRRSFFAASLLAGSLVAASAGEARERGVPTGQHAPATEAALDTEVHAVLQILYASRMLEAEARARQLADSLPEDPRVHLLLARVLRESFPDQDAEHEEMRRQAVPIHAALERGIAAAGRLIEHDPDSVPGRLYRGWAHLFRAQLHALADEYWSAGRQAKKGHRDLEAVLRADPRAADAHGVLGTYLYFADLLPGVVKVARTLVRVPGGDRDRGLEGLAIAARHAGYDQLDAEALLGVIHFAFEGDFAAAVASFEPMLERFDTNPRLQEPIAVLDLLQAHTVGGGLRQTAWLADMHAGSESPWNRQMSQRLRFYQALGELVQGHLDAAQVHLEALHREAPRAPDWLRRDVGVALADLYLLRGAGERASLLHAGADAALQRRLAYVLEPGAAATPAEAARMERSQAILRRLHGGDAGRAAAALDSLETADDPLMHFHRGDAALLAGDAPGAARHYERLTGRLLPQRLRLFRFLAFARLAEVRAGAGDGREAERLLQRALDETQDRDLLRHVVRARHRYYARGGGAGNAVVEGAGPGQALGGSGP